MTTALAAPFDQAQRTLVADECGRRATSSRSVGADGQRRTNERLK
jgi:hypothetical protein